MTTIIAQSDPWQKYKNQGKKPGVPEPVAYGAILIALIAALVILKRIKS